MHVESPSSAFKIFYCGMLCIHGTEGSQGGLSRHPLALGQLCCEEHQFSVVLGQLFGFLHSGRSLAVGFGGSVVDPGRQMIAPFNQLLDFKLFFSF